MVHLTQRITSVTMNKALTLSSDYTGKAAIALLRKANGAGYASNVPGTSFNSLASLAIGDNVDVILTLPIPSGGVDFDNGTAATGGTTPRNPYVKPFAVYAADPLVVDSFAAVEDVNRATLSSSIPAGCSLAYAINGGSYLSEANANAAIAALTDAQILAGYTIQIQFTRATQADQTGTFTLTYL